MYLKPASSIAHHVDGESQYRGFLQCQNMVGTLMPRTPKVSRRQNTEALPEVAYNT